VQEFNHRSLTAAYIVIQLSIPLLTPMVQLHKERELQIIHADKTHSAIIAVSIQEGVIIAAVLR